MPAKLHVNGREIEADDSAGRPLLEVLRDDLGLTGCKYGCGEGQCGACTVLINGRTAHACLETVASAANRKIRTIEGLVENGTLHPVQQAFLDAEAFQCGYCTSGMVLAAVALLDANPAPSDEEITAGMNGNICRCGGYNNIREAVHRAAKTLRDNVK